jgi:hypothetical protein
LAPPFWRDCFGATDLTLDVLAQSRFGAGHFSATKKLKLLFNER